MRLPARSTKASRLLEGQGYYLQVRLQSDSDCAEFATRWTACQQALRTAVENCTQGRMTVTRTLAERDGADAAVDRQVRLIHRTISAMVKSNPRSKLLQTYFPEGSHAITSAHPTKEVGLVEAILAKLETETEPRLTALKEPLRTANTAFRTAVQTHEAALEALRTAVELEQAARIQWFSDYQAVAYELNGRFVDDPARVETYFKPSSHTTPKDDEDDDEAGTDGGAGTGSGTARATAMAGAGAVADARSLGADPLDGRGLES